MVATRVTNLTRRHRCQESPPAPEVAFLSDCGLAVPRSSAVCLAAVESFSLLLALASSSASLCDPRHEEDVDRILYDNVCMRARPICWIARVNIQLCVRVCFNCCFAVAKRIWSQSTGFSLALSIDLASASAKEQPGCFAKCV